MVVSRVGLATPSSAFDRVVDPSHPLESPEKLFANSSMVQLLQKAFAIILQTIYTFTKQRRVTYIMRTVRPWNILQQ